MLSYTAAGLVVVLVMRMPAVVLIAIGVIRSRGRVIHACACRRVPIRRSA